MKRKIRVLYLAHDDRMLGGANRSLLNMIQSLDDEVEAIVVTPRHAEVYQYFVNAGIQCLSLPVPQCIHSVSDRLWERIWKFPFRLVKKYIQKKCLLRGLHKYFPTQGIVDIVHSNTAVVNVGRDVARMLGARHVWHLREYIDLDHGLKLMVTWKSLRKAIAASDATIAVSHSVQSHFLKNAGLFDVCFYNAVVSQWMEGDVLPLTSDREKSFLFVGTLSDSKGARDALLAFVHFYKKHLDWSLYMVGTGKADYIEKLHLLCVKYNCDSAVHFEGFCKNPSSYYMRCYAFLMCSGMEALGRTTIEAMNYGCIPIGRDTGGTSEIICNGKTGFLFHTNAELEQRMENVISNSYDSLRWSAHLFAQKMFTPMVYKKSILDLYRQLLNQPD